jgi:excisionase family DNA binding protein
MTTTPERLLLPQEVADWLGIPLQTLYSWRVDTGERRGPTGIKIGRHLRYRRADVEAWLDTHRDDW